MTIVANARKVEVPVDDDGAVNSDDIRMGAGIPANRALILQRSDGSNQLVNPGERIHVKSGQHFVDAAGHIRGQV
jgi:hypothetical protein